MGQYIWFEEYPTPIYKNGQFVKVQGIYRNIDDKVKLLQQLEYQSTLDGLTDMFNREYFHLKMDDYDQRKVSIIIVVGDLDELKSINDQYGHQMGDPLIREAAACLKNSNVFRLCIPSLFFWCHGKISI